MGQRKKGNKLFRWMRPSDLSDATTVQHSELSPVPVHLTTTGGVHSSANKGAAAPLPGSRAPRPTSIPISGSVNDSKYEFVESKHKEKADSGNGGIVILRVKELKINQCFTPKRLRAVPISLLPENSTIVWPSNAGSRRAQQTTGHINANQHPALPEFSDPNPGEPKPASSKHNTKHLTDPKPQKSPLIIDKKNHRLSSIAEIRIPVGPKSLQRSKRLASEKTISCRLYDCIIPAGCTARNASSEPPESRTPSVIKFDLGQLPHQQRSSSSSSSLISRTAQLSKRKFLLDIMDRSVDSIGSCSLDVDAESTDFSDTSGSLNLCTPSSGKDFTREFTSRIHERCQLGQIVCQKATTILDPASGQIKTVLSSTTEELSPTHSRSSSPAKKPSYLNLACCVNGYSNLTTYDSKLRQNINKSREVSPIRPIIHTLQYNRGEANAPYLVVPVPMPIVNDNHLTAMDTTNNASSKLTTTKMLSSPDKRFYSSSTSTTTTSSSMTTRTTSSSIEVNLSKDVTDNMGYLKSSSLASALAAGRHNDAESSPKSFIQQRVERLYGPSALAAGFFSPKRSQNDSGSVLSERSQNTTSIHRFKTDYRSAAVTVTSSAPAVTPPPPRGTISTTIESLENNHDHHHQFHKSNSDTQTSLPVLRHLRPEFRAQLPIVSPKRSLAKSDFVAASNGGDHKANSDAEPASANGQQLHTNKYTTSAYALPSSYTTKTSTNNTNPNQIHSNRHNQPQPVFVDDGRHDETVVVLPMTTTTTSNHIHQNTTTKQPLSSNGTSKPTNGVFGGAAAAATLPQPQQAASNNSRVHHQSMQLTIDQQQDDVPATGPVPIPIMSTMATQKPTNGHGFHNGSAVQPDLVKDAAVPGLDPAKHAVVVTNGNGGAKVAQQETVAATAAKNGVKNGLFFLDVLNAERDRLLALAVTAEQYMETLATKPDADEEILGHLRSAAGKARLLSTQKVRQFEGLCHKNLNQVPGEKFATTDEDLEGFWDMVMLQVDHVDQLFREIEDYRANNWQKLPVAAKQNPPTGSKLTKRPMGRGGTTVPTSASTNGSAAAAAKKTAAAQASAARREEQRQQLLELKRRHKKTAATEENGGVAMANGATTTSS